MALEISETPGRPYKINLPTFEGPLDLLLYLIRKDELDIWDIPIARITDEYLSHLELMQELNLDIAGEFLLMAATLTTLKSRMLLPTETGQSPEEIEDPRTELVERLLEYQRYREAAEGLSKRVVLNRDVFERGQSAVKLPEGEPIVLPEVTLFELLSALQDVLGRAQARGYIHTVSAERFSVVERIHWLHDHIRSAGPVGFRAMFGELGQKMDVVMTFLALLEMLKANILTLELDLSRLPEAVRRKLLGEDGPVQVPATKTGRQKLPVAESAMGAAPVQTGGADSTHAQALSPVSSLDESSLDEEDALEDELLDDELLLDDEDAQEEPGEPEDPELLALTTLLSRGDGPLPVVTGPEERQKPVPELLPGGANDHAWSDELDAELAEELKSIVHKPLSTSRRRKRVPPPEPPIVVINDLDWIVREKNPGTDLLMDWRGID